ncbi:MAG: ComEC/Rec2 family competence protein [Spirochaetota bacterium]
MRIYDVVFYLAGFFILGVFGASSKISLPIILSITAFAAVLFLFVGFYKNSKKIFWLAGLSLIIAVGAFYFNLKDFNREENIKIIFNEKIDFQGLVIKDPKRGEWQDLIIKLMPPYSGNISVKLPLYPSFNYGDLINFSGKIEKPLADEYADYLKKENISGTAAFLKTELVAENKGLKIKSILFDLKNKTIANLQKVLPAESAAFMSGIILGERAEFSKKLKIAMANSGTTHLVALSGYNISVIGVAIGVIFGYFLSRRWTFALSVLVILTFVLMTGAEASVVRAAVMGSILLLAKQVGRIYSFKNAIVLAAFFMILENPRILNFDVGFQLSFAALLGLVYLAPAIEKLFHLNKEKDFFGIKENFLNSFSAQLAVAPMLISYFGNFSLIAIISNVLILTFMPITMALGFILAGLGFISYYFSLVFGWFVNLFLAYELFIIKFFGGLDIFKINFSSMVLFIIYYVTLVGFIILANRKNQKVKNKNIINNANIIYHPR